MKVWLKFFAALALVAVSANVRGQSSWNVPGGNWTVPTDWTPNGVPANDGTISITFNFGSSAYTSTLDTNYLVNSVTIGGGSNTFTLMGGNTLTVGGGDFTDNSGHSADINVFLAGAMNLALTGNSTLTLHNHNTYTGNTNVSAGTLTDAGPNTFSPNSLLQVGSAGTVVVANNETANGLNNFSGAGGSVVLNTGTTLVLNGAFSTTFSGIISGAGTLEQDSAGTMTLKGANTYSGTTSIGAGSDIDIGGGTSSGSIASPLIAGNGSITFDLTGPLYVYTGNIANGVHVVKFSSGTTQLSGFDNYTGATTVNGGTLQAGSTNAFGQGNSAVTVNTTGTLDLNGFNNTIASLAGDPTGFVTLGSANLTISDTSANPTSYDGVISGIGGSLTMSGNVLELINANTYTGGTTITSGTLLADNPSGSATGTGPITIGPGGALLLGQADANGNINPTAAITDNGALQVFRTGSFTLANTITGTGGIDIDGSGTTKLTGINSYSGTTNIQNAGTLQAGSTSAFGGPTGLSPLTFAGNGTLDLNGFSNTVGSLNGTGSSSILLGSSTLTVGDPSGGGNYSGVISGVGGSMVFNTNATILTGDNTYTGGTTITSGIVLVANTSGSGLGTGPISISPGATLMIGANGTDGAVAATTITNNGAVTLSRSDSPTFTNNIVGSGSVTMVGSGAVTLGGTNTYSGFTTVAAGELVAGSTSAFGGATGSSLVTIVAGDLVLEPGFDNTVGEISGTSSGGVQLIGASLTLDGAIPTTFGGVISGTGGLTIAGTAQLILTGNNTYTGGTTITSGELDIGDGGTPGARISGNILNNASLVFALSSSDVFTYSGNISGSGSLLLSGPGALILGGSNSYSGNTGVSLGILSDSAANTFSPNSRLQVAPSGQVDINFNQTVADIENTGGGASIVIGSGATLTSLGHIFMAEFQGVISGPGAFAISAGSQVLSGSNTYAGGTFMSGNSEFFVGTDTAFGTGTVTLAGSDTEISPDANVTLANNFVLNSTLDNDDGGTNSMTLTGQISGPGGITWCTPSALVLTNNNSFTGGVDMREGFLYLNSNTAAGSGAITLDTGTSLNVMNGVMVINSLNFTGTSATLTGNGTIASPVVANSGVIIAPAASPGNGPGNLTFSTGLTLASGATLDFALYDANGVAGTGYSLFTATGGLSLTASANTIAFNLQSINSTGGAAAAINFNPASAYSWTFATSSSAITGFNPNQFVLNTGAFSNGIGSGVFSFSEVGNNLELNFTPVPEPSTWAMMGAGLLAFAPFALRRRQAAKA